MTEKDLEYLKELHKAISGASLIVAQMRLAAVRPGVLELINGLALAKTGLEQLLGSSRSESAFRA